MIGTCDQRAVAWRNGVSEVLPLPTGFVESLGVGVNDNGTLVGNCLASSYTAACIWEDGAVRILPIPPDAAGTSAVAINSLGDVAGTLLLAEPGPPGPNTRAFVWNSGGSTRRLDVNNPELTTWSADINDHGAVAVNMRWASSLYTLVWTESETVGLGSSFGLRYNVSGINNSGQVVGYRYQTGGTTLEQAVLWKDGVETSLPTPDGRTDACTQLAPSSSACTYAVAINDNRDVIGIAYDPREFDNFRAILWRDGVGEYLDAIAPGFALSVPFGSYRFVAYRSRISNGGIIAGSIGDAAALLVPAAPDVTPPTLLLPTTTAVDGTSPAGAMVTYAVSATDEVDPHPVVTCSPISGSVFPLLRTTVTCTATDDAGNQASGTFEVLVRDADQQLEEPSAWSPAGS